MLQMEKLMKMENYQIISDYCIGTNGNVKSVNLYSNVPLNKIGEIILDFHSQSSITLTKVLSKFYWKKEFTFINANKDYINNIAGTTAGVVIGDRTFGMENTFEYVYDLSAEWKKFTGLPFVFACWVANKKIENPEFLFWFEIALQKGINEKDLVANLANIAAALKQSFDFLWVGFYLVKENELVLGPFQGPIACTRISFGKGVCGTSWKEKKTIVVEDVDKFPGHIACSSDSKSEIVVPVIKNGNVAMVLDVDSSQFASFNQTDELWLGKICNLIEGKLS
jgi:GAF domain-containing protein